MGPGAEFLSSNPTLPCVSCVTLSRTLNISEPVFPYPYLSSKAVPLDDYEHQMR